MLQFPIHVTFEIITETERALIVKNLKVLDKPFITECNIPKVAVSDIKTNTKTQVVEAHVEQWVLRQRKNEEVNRPHADGLAQALLAEFEDAPF